MTLNIIETPVLTPINSIVLIAKELVISATFNASLKLDKSSIHWSSDILLVDNEDDSLWDLEEDIIGEVIYLYRSTFRYRSIPETGNADVITISVHIGEVKVSSSTTITVLGN